MRPWLQEDLALEHAWQLLDTMTVDCHRQSRLLMAISFQVWRRLGQETQLKALEVEQKRSQRRIAESLSQRSFTAWAALQQMRYKNDHGWHYKLLFDAWQQWCLSVKAGLLASWRRMVSAKLVKIKQQVALEGLVDALDARASRAHDMQTQTTTVVIDKLLVQVAFIAWRSWWQASEHQREMGQVRQALSSTESCAKLMLRDVVTDLNANSELLGCMLIFRSWYFLVLSHKLGSCQRGFIAWARLRKDDMIPDFTPDLGRMGLLSAAWRQWHLFAKSGPLVAWRRLAQLALQRLCRQVALESLVDALDMRASQRHLEMCMHPPDSSHDGLATIWVAWRAVVGDGGTGCIARWRHLVLASLRKLQHQVALEGLVDALDARASRAHDMQKQTTTVVIDKLLVQVAFIAWRSWWQASEHQREMGQVRQALSSTESCAKLMLRDVVADLNANSELLGCMLIFRSWYFLVLSHKLGSCQRGFIAWARLRKDDMIPDFTPDLGRMGLLSAAWRQWHLFAKSGPLVAWRRLAQLALQRLCRQVALESLVDALDMRASQRHLEMCMHPPDSSHDGLATIWVAWRALVGDGGTGCIARWRHLVLASLRKLQHQVALEGLVDALDARASRAHDMQKQTTTVVIDKLLVQVAFIAWRSWWQASEHQKEMGQVRQALSSTESCAKLMLRDVVADLNANSDLLGCMLIFRSWYFLLLGHKLGSCQRGFIAWARLRKDHMIPDFTPDLGRMGLLSAAWRQWHLFAKSGPLVAWRALVQAALQRLSRHVGLLESLVDALDMSTPQGHLETCSDFLHDGLAKVWVAWCSLVGAGGTGYLARWRHLVLASLRKLQHQVALEGLVDAVSAQAARAEAADDWLGGLGAFGALPPDLAVIFRCWGLTTKHNARQRQCQNVWSQVTLRDANFLHLQAAFQQWGLEVKSLQAASRRLLSRLERAVGLGRHASGATLRVLLKAVFGSWRSQCHSRPNHDGVSQISLSPIRPSGTPLRHLSAESSSRSSTFLSPKQPEEEEVPTDLVEAVDCGGQPEEEQAPQVGVFQPFYTPSLPSLSGHTRADSEPRLDTLDLFDQLEIERPEPISAREEEIQKRIYLKRMPVIRDVMRRLG